MFFGISCYHNSSRNDLRVTDYSLLEMRRNWLGDANGTVMLVSSMLEDARGKGVEVGVHVEDVEVNVLVWMGREEIEANDEADEAMRARWLRKTQGAENVE